MAKKIKKEDNKYQEKIKLDKQLDFDESMKRLLNVKPEVLKQQKKE